MESRLEELDSIVYVLYFDEDSKKKAIETFGKYNWAKPFFNRSDKYLENNFYQRIMLRKDEWINKKFVGCISYKFPEKCPRINIEQIIKEQENKDIDVIGLYTPHATFKWGEYVQPGCITILAQIIKVLMIPISNHFLIKNHSIVIIGSVAPILLKYIYFIDEIIEKN